MSIKSRFRGFFGKQYGKHAQALLKSASQYLYHMYLLLPRKLSWRKSLVLTCKILERLVKTLATNEKYPALNRDSLTIPIQMQLSRKENTFSEFPAPFPKSRLNLDILKKKMTFIDIVFSKLRTAKT